MLLYDAAWGAPPPAAMRAVGYSGAWRYLGGGARLTPGERDAIHAAGLAILLVFEQSADMADHPENAEANAQQAQQEADQLGYPDGCPIFFADDRNDTVDNERPYFARVDRAHRRETGAYGPLGTLVVAHAEGVEYGWGVGTWGLGEAPGGILPASFPDVVNAVQLANLHAPCPAGVDPASFDTNVMVTGRDIPMWAPDGGVTTGGSMPSTDEIVTALTTPGPYGISPITASVMQALDLKVSPKDGIDGKPWRLTDWLLMFAKVDAAQQAGVLEEAIAGALTKQPGGAGTVDTKALAKAILEQLGDHLTAPSGA